MGAEASTFIPEEIAESNIQHPILLPDLPLIPLIPTLPTDNGNGFHPEHNGHKKKKKKSNMLPNIEPFSENGSTRLVFDSLALPIYMGEDNIEFEFFKKSQSWRIHYFSGEMTEDELPTPSAEEYQSLVKWLINNHDQRYLPRPPRNTKAKSSLGASHRHD